MATIPAPKSIVGGNVTFTPLETVTININGSGVQLYAGKETTIPQRFYSIYTEHMKGR